MKIPPRDQEENRLLLLKGEQCYEESTGEARERIERLQALRRRWMARPEPDSGNGSNAAGFIAKTGL
ncbi:MAG: hypothetical protein ACLVDB_10050 [Anaeromassilibacillus sp.]